VSVIEEIAAERARQISEEEWSPDHDVYEHPYGDLADAAGCYALYTTSTEGIPYSSDGSAPPPWPWDKEWWKPKGRRRDLIRAAALIVAEIERMDRTAEPK